MYYELYIDVFFLENFMLDSLLLLIVNRVMNNGRPYIRLLLGGALGSVLTCLAVAAPIPSAIRMLAFHTIISSVMVCAGLRILRLSQFVQALVLLYAAAFLTGGVMQLFRPYMRYVSVFYAAAAVSYVVILKLWKIFSHIHRQQSRILSVTLYTEHGEKPMRALLDTGNELRDCYTGEPVNIIAPETAAEISDRTGKRIPSDPLPLRQRRVCNESVPGEKDMHPHGRGQMDRCSPARDRRRESVRWQRV